MKSLFNLKTNTVNNNTTNTTTTEGVKTMKKTRKIKTKIIAGILSAVTVFSVGTMAIGSASAAVPPAMMGTVLK